MRREVDIGRDEILDDIQQHLFVGHVAHLIEKLETADDLLDVIGETIEVVLDIRQQNLLVVGGSAVQLL